jgi:hypothetical protein
MKDCQSVVAGKSSPVKGEFYRNHKDQIQKYNIKKIIREIERDKKKRVLKPEIRETKEIRQYGYRYILVKVDRLYENRRIGEGRSSYIKISDPCFMGFQGFALKTCGKIRLNLFD